MHPEAQPSQIFLQPGLAKKQLFLGTENYVAALAVDVLHYAGNGWKFGCKLLHQKLGKGKFAGTGHQHQQDLFTVP